MPSPIAVNVGTSPALLWSGRAAPGINTLLLMNTDTSNTVMVGTDLTSLVVPIAPNGSLSVDPGSPWYVVGLVAGNSPLVVVPNGQSNFLGLSEGMGNIAIPQFQSPNYDAATGVGWALFRDGTASFNEITLVIQANGVALLIYFPTPGFGNLIGSWAASEFTDQYGNDVPAGLNANGGTLASITLSNPSVVGGTILQALLDACTITNSNLSNGTSYEQTITFDSGGGMLLGYTNTVTTVTQTANGTYTQTLPAGVNQISNSQVWGAGAGGDGGLTSEGGNAGGAGEFAGESSYTPSVNPFTYVVGNGGNNSTTGGGHGGDGGDSFIDGGGILANGGNGNGSGGTGSTNTVHFDGGSGGPTSGNSGAASGGNSGNPTAAGNNGLASTGSVGAASPTAQTNSGHGGAGGSNGANGSNGTSPGAGGGGAGQGTGTSGTLTKTYEALYTASYYGPDSTNGNHNGLRSTSTMWHGGETASGGSANGNQRSVMVFDSNQIAADFAGFTPTGMTVKLVNQHTYNNSGMTVEIDVGASPQKYPTSISSVPAHWLGNQNSFLTSTIAEGATKVFNLGATCAGFFINNQTNFLGLAAFVSANHPYNTTYYGYFAGGHSVNVEITITGTQTVAGNTTSGQGSDGKVSFAFSNTQVMAFALAPVAGSDTSGNAFASGYTGPLSTFHPGSSPSTVEGWQSLSLQNGWILQNTLGRYKFYGDNQVLVELQLNDSSATSGTMFTLPVGYRPSVSQFGLLSLGSAATGVNVAVVQITTGGAFNVLSWVKQSSQYLGNILISLD